MAYGCQTPSAQRRSDQYLNNYVTSSAEIQTDLSLCRQYSLQTYVTADRYTQFIILLDKLKFKMKTHCIEIEIVKDNLKKADSYTEPEQNGIIMIEQNKVYFI